MKDKEQFFCSNCGNTFGRWSGECQACNSWNTIVQAPKESRSSTTTKSYKHKNISAVSIDAIKTESSKRIKTNIGELDRVLGGGLIFGSVVLIGGDPGIGKSTLMLQGAFASNRRVLYVSAEESESQIKNRGERLNAISSKIQLIMESDLFAIEDLIKKELPEIVIIDSIQTVFKPDTIGATGSPSQVKEAAAYVVKIAKENNIPIFLVGHVTKDGNIAGPKLLEHIVDVVLYFEGEEHKQFRIIRGIKNRFGSISEVGIFEMREDGLKEVFNPSELFLSERPKGAPGSSIAPVIEGSRPILVEIQALAAFTKMAIPRRTFAGIDFNRGMIIAAILEKRADIRISTLDLFINIAGGIKAGEPAIDLPTALAIASSYKNRPIKEKLTSIGELGLAGEVRGVSFVEARVKEAEKLGFEEIILPKGNEKQIKPSKIRPIYVSSINEALSKAIF